MNNQFATQHLLEEMDAYDSLRSMLSELGAAEDAIEVLVNAVKVGLLKPSDAIKIVKSTTGIDETSTTGGGVAGGPTAANWDPQGPTGTGEQMATTKAFGKKKKYQEGTYEDDEIAIFDGGEDGLTKIYKKKDGTFYGINDEFDFVAKNEEEMLRKLSQFGYKHLYGNLEEDAPRLAGEPSKTSKQGAKNISAYTSVGFQKAPSAEEAGKKMKGIDVDMLWKEGDDKVTLSNDDMNNEFAVVDKSGKLVNAVYRGWRRDGMHLFDPGVGTTILVPDKEVENKVQRLKESRAYSQFKKQASTRTKDQQMHEAVKMVHRKLDEISKLLEYTKQMKSELSEGEEMVEYKSNTVKVFEKINTKVVEVYSKLKGLK